jgi:DNA-binding CsgD family transcriptional regulator
VYLQTVPLAVGALLERDRELETLRDGLSRAATAEGTLVLLEGPAGAGKTALTRAARELADRAGMVTLEARGSELEQSFGFGAVRQLLEPVAMEEAEGGALFAGAAGPAARLFEPEERFSPNAEADFEALHSLYWLVVNLADSAPVLLSVDDCQWVDLDSLRFFAYLAQRIEGLPVAMLLAGRPPDSTLESAGSPWAQLLARPEAIALQVRPLSQDAAVILARERLGEEADDGFCRSCHAATGGNPLFLRELLRALEAAAVVPSAEAAAEVQTVGPATVSRFVLHRMASLGPSATELARAVAVLGDDSELPLAARIAGLDEVEARAAADDLVRAEIFVRAERLSFIHPIVRAALYEDLAPGERQERHAAAADVLAIDGASPERVTAHLLLTPATGDPGRVRTLRSAASSAARRGAPRAAAECLRRALAESPGERERGEILADLGRYEIAAMRFEAAMEHLQAAVRSGAGPVARATAASFLGRCAIVSDGLEPEAAAEAMASVALELQSVDPERSLEVSSDLLMLATVVPSLRPGVDARLHAFAEQAMGHPGYEAVARIHAAHEGLARGGSAAAAADEVQAALATGVPPAAVTTAGYLAAITLRYAERYEPAMRLLDAGLEGARLEGHATRQGIIHGQRAGIALDQGALHDAQVEAETGLLLIEAPHFEVLQLVAVAIAVHLERGELDAAAEAADSGEALGLTDDRTFAPDYLMARGRLRVAQGLLREGAEDLLWSGRQLEARNYRWGAAWKALAASALASLGETETAARLAGEQLAMARRVGAPRMLGLSLRHAAAIGGDERLPLLEEAVSVLEPSLARLELAHALSDLGKELSRTGRRREGRSAQRRAMELAETCGAVALANSARSELQSGPGRRARIELTGPAALTAAEWRVCRQASEGRTNREIAQALFVTEKTVERHLSSAYHKLGVRSRFQLLSAIGEEVHDAEPGPAPETVG